ncbi:MAG: 4'-phosphopantetheinyl transferase superfamily protein [Candidatus Poseidoniaceae archaeon]|jgi:4'-phosphopantetheinyl transferase EntD|tara:strand:- start:657 stop:1412 length:756 start_codon:yes stop_codon:yes gene_type:complete
MMFEELFPPHQLPVRSLCFRCPVEPREFDQVTLASGDEVATFAVDKRRDEHLSGRWLLAQALNQWGLDPTQIEVRRTELRAPVLAHLPGLWVNTPLPSVSIGHAGGWAYVALVEPGWSIGIDAELSDRGIASNAFDMMAKGDELLWLQKNPEQAIYLWTSKESVQKAMQMGMHLNPRNIEIPIGVGVLNISIENSKIQLQNWVFSGCQVALAWRQGSVEFRTPEDDLLDATKKAMSEQEWSIGCKTSRGNA